MFVGVVSAPPRYETYSSGPENSRRPLSSFIDEIDAIGRQREIIETVEQPQFEALIA